MIRFRSTTYANITATAALVIALGGTSYAAASLARNSVGSAQVKNHSLLAEDVKAGQLTAGALDARLPSGATERGGWGQSSEDPASGEIQTSAFSFPVPLAKNVKAKVIQEGAGPTANCPGTVTAPKAAKGFLCVYVGGGNNHVNVRTYAAVDGDTNYRFGAIAYWRPTAAGTFTYASGTYAVRAP
jgi:hypothetical protein